MAGGRSLPLPGLGAGHSRARRVRAADWWWSNLFPEPDGIQTREPFLAPTLDFGVSASFRMPGLGRDFEPGNGRIGEIRHGARATWQWQGVAFRGCLVGEKI